MIHRQHEIWRVGISCYKEVLMHPCKYLLDNSNEECTYYQLGNGILIIIINNKLYNIMLNIFKLYNLLKNANILLM